MLGGRSRTLAEREGFEPSVQENLYAGFRTRSAHPARVGLIVGEVARQARNLPSARQVGRIRPHKLGRQGVVLCDAGSTGGTGLVCGGSKLSSSFDSPAEHDGEQIGLGAGCRACADSRGICAG